MTNNTEIVSVPRVVLLQALENMRLVRLAEHVQEGLRAALEAVPAEDVRAIVEGCTPQDYAIEHAGFLATAADQVLADYQAYTLAQMLADEGGDEGEAELTDAIDEARDDLHEGLRNLREMVYEFRKRRDRAIPK